MEENNNNMSDFKIDEQEINNIEMVEVPKKAKTVKAKITQPIIEQPKEEGLINCLRNERVIIRYIPRERGNITNPKHVLYGGMAETAKRTFVVPRLTSGLFVNVLTDSEKAFLEEIMGLEYNALSVYKKVDNFWDDSNEQGISRVTLNKQDNFLDLSSPDDYIKYKILLANKDFIAPSLQVLQDSPKATYQFVIISEGEENKQAKDSMSITMKCYKEFGKIENNVNVLRVIIETVDGRPTAPNSKLEFLQTKLNELIQADAKLVYKVMTDPYLETKVLIKQALEQGILSKRGDYYYNKADSTPLCEHNEEPTLSIAAKYLSNPKHQDIRFAIEANLSK